MITLGGKKVDAPLEIVQIFWLQLEILHSEQILSKKFDKRLQFRYRSVNFKIRSKHLKPLPNHSKQRSSC